MSLPKVLKDQNETASPISYLTSLCILNYSRPRNWDKTACLSHTLDSTTVYAKRIKRTRDWLFKKRKTVSTNTMKFIIMATEVKSSTRGSLSAKLKAKLQVIRPPSTWNATHLKKSIVAFTTIEKDKDLEVPIFWFLQLYFKKFWYIWISTWAIDIHANAIKAWNTISFGVMYNHSIFPNNCKI